MAGEEAGKRGLMQPVESPAAQQLLAVFLEFGVLFGEVLALGGIDAERVNGGVEYRVCKVARLFQRLREVGFRCRDALRITQTDAPIGSRQA